MASRLRKALISSTLLQDNAGSFVNVTAKDLHIRKLKLSLRQGGAIVRGDAYEASVDEVPAIQATVNDSRAHIQHGLIQASEQVGADGGTGLYGPQKDTMTFERGQLVLEPDEALFLNTSDLGGAPTVITKLNIWYED